MNPRQVLLDASARIDARDLAARVDLPDAGHPPLTVVAGPCRSGTTALLRAAAAAGNRGYFQPIKRIIRSALVGLDSRCTIVAEDRPAVVKETFGPFVPAEVDFDPVSILRSRGYPAWQLGLVVTLRHPVDLYVSWQRFCALNPNLGGPDPELFRSAYRQALTVHRRTRAAGHPVSAFACDAFVGDDRSRVVRSLFKRHALIYSADAVEWGDDASNSLDALVVREPEPELFRCPGALDGVRRATAFKLAGRSAQTADPSRVPAVVTSCIPDYEQFVGQSHADLGGFDDRH